MNCEWVTKNAPLFLYGELSLEEEQSFQDHVETCAACRKAFEAEKAIHGLLDEREVEPPAPLLVRCRRDLELRLGAARERAVLRGWFGRAFGGDRQWARGLMRPAGALALIALGFFTARWTSQPPAGVARSSEPVVSRIRYVQPEASGKVQLVLEETRQRVVSGDPQDESIHRMLLAAARDATDPGLRVESMDILKARPASDDVRAALVQALQQDPNPGVRLKALDALRPYVAQADVRGVLAKALLSDDNPGVRTQAIDLLTQKKDDEAMVGLLQELIQKDDNNYVRLKCRKALQEMNASVGTF